MLKTQHKMISLLILASIGVILSVGWGISFIVSAQSGGIVTSAKKYFEFKDGTITSCQKGSNLDW